MRSTYLLVCFLFLVLNQSSYSQEWKNKKQYFKANGTKELKDGHWLKKDRKKNRARWIEANRFNINLENGHEKYKKISQRRDFYKWFDQERKKMGHDIKWPGMASIVSGQFSKLDSWFIRFFIIRNKKVVKFGNEGNKAIFDDVFKWLQDVYNSEKLVKDEVASKWDDAYVHREQCIVIEKVYVKQNEKTLKKIAKMAKGKGLYCFGVPKKLKYVGDITDCEERIAHGVGRLKEYYSEKQEKKKAKKTK